VAALPPGFSLSCSNSALLKNAPQEPTCGSQLRPGIGFEAGDDVLARSAIVQRDDHRREG
jgi:hypothetical protein